MKKIKINKSVTRKISTGSYESVDVFTNIIGEIEYQTDSEFQIQSKMLDEKLVESFTAQYNQCLTLIGNDRLLGTVTNNVTGQIEDVLPENFSDTLVL